jgi:hypothetical protein
MTRSAETDACPALVSTLHDPAERMRGALDRHGRCLSRYAAAYVAATETTDRRLIEAVRSLGASVALHPPGVPGTAQRAALAAAVAAGHASFLCCDFDRWLHWLDRYPDELADLPTRLTARRPAPWLVCLGRTARAFRTHPPVQQAAEAATNRALSLAAGRRLDATAGASWLSRPGAALVLAGSVETTKAVDLEWPALVLRADRRRLAGVRTEGLEFETAGFYANEIAAAGGLAAWMAQIYDRPEVWRDRLRLAADSVAALARVLGEAAG